jgi:hypothetical protein
METHSDEYVRILSLEYQSLRSDLVMRSAARFQFLGLVIASAAILGTGLGGSHSNLATRILVILGVVLFCLGLISFWLQGRDQAVISAQIAAIETRINELVPTEPVLLNWETTHQERTVFNRWILGLRLPENGNQRKALSGRSTTHPSS